MVQKDDNFLGSDPSKKMTSRKTTSPKKTNHHQSQHDGLVETYIDGDLFEFHQSALEDFEKRIQVIMEEDDDCIYELPSPTFLDEDRDDVGTSECYEDDTFDDNLLNDISGYNFSQDKNWDENPTNALDGGWSDDIKFDNHSLYTETCDETQGPFLCAAETLFSPECYFYQKPALSPSVHNDTHRGMAPTSEQPQEPSNALGRDTQQRRIEESTTDTEGRSLDSQSASSSKTSSKDSLPPLYHARSVEGSESSLGSGSKLSQSMESSFSLTESYSSCSVTTDESPVYPPKLAIKGLEKEESRKQLVRALSELVQKRWNPVELAVVSMSTSSSTKHSIHKSTRTQPGEQAQKGQEISSTELSKPDSSQQIRGPSSTQSATACSRRNRFCKARRRLASRKSKGKSQLGNCKALKQSLGISRECISMPENREALCSFWNNNRGDFIVAMTIFLLRVSSQSSRQLLCFEQGALVTYCSPLEKWNTWMLYYIKWGAENGSGDTFRKITLVKEKVAKDLKSLDDNSDADVVHPLFKEFVRTGYEETNLADCPYIFAHRTNDGLGVEDECDGLILETKILPWLGAELRRELAAITLEPFERAIVSIETTSVNACKEVKDNDQIQRYPYSSIHRVVSKRAKKQLSSNPKKVQSLADVDFIDLSDLSDSSNDWSIEADLPLLPRVIPPNSAFDVRTNGPHKRVHSSTLSATWSMEADLPLPRLVVEPALVAREESVRNNLGQS